MDKLVVPDCPECYGKGDVPFDPTGDVVARRPCSTCVERWHDANPLPKQPTTLETLYAEYAALRTLADAVGVWRDARRRCDGWVKSDGYDPSEMAYFDAVDKAEDAIDAVHDALAKAR